MNLQHPKSLYALSLEHLYNKTVYFCLLLRRCEQTTEFHFKVDEFQRSIVEKLPNSIVQDILELHNVYDHEKKSCRRNKHNALTKISYYFYLCICTKNVEKFTAKNIELQPTCWHELLPKFEHLRYLNVALNCDDHLLGLIADHCPNLEYLNATCKNAVVYVSNNAPSFHTSVTDAGIKKLCKLKKLRQLITREPNSGRGRPQSLTMDGLRFLLRHVRTLEHIRYEDLGTVIANGLENMDELNIREIQHFNPTTVTLTEIFRLCRRLESLILNFFYILSSADADILETIIASKLKLRSISLNNLDFQNKFMEFLEPIGQHLERLSLTGNTYSYRYTFENVRLIGDLCPYLQYLEIGNLTSEHIDRQYPRNNNCQPFRNLHTLCLRGTDLNIEKYIRYCTENSRTFSFLSILDHGWDRSVDRMFDGTAKPFRWPAIAELFLSRSLLFSTASILTLIDKYPTLRNVCVYTPTKDFECIRERFTDKNSYFRYEASLNKTIVKLWAMDYNE